MDGTRDRRGSRGPWHCGADFTTPCGQALKKGDRKPHRIRYGLTPGGEEAFDGKVHDICTLSQEAPKLATRGERVGSPDELTGVQALERKPPGLPLAPGKVERRECESMRHGTRTFIITRDVVSGQILKTSGGPTRTQADFLAHIEALVATDPEATRWPVVVDNLDTHRSASLGYFVATLSNLDIDLAKQGKHGIWKHRQSRAAFLRDPSHRSVVHDTPKHASWLNQIDICLRILVRKLLKRGSCRSVEDLQHKVLAFIAYSNRTMAKPFQWTYQGQALTV
jgi:hypothetical protein